LTMVVEVQMAEMVERVELRDGILRKDPKQLEELSGRADVTWVQDEFSWVVVVVVGWLGRLQPTFVFAYVLLVWCCWCLVLGSWCLVVVVFVVVVVVIIVLVLVVVMVLVLVLVLVGQQHGRSWYRLTNSSQTVPHLAHEVGVEVAVGRG